MYGESLQNIGTWFASLNSTDIEGWFRRVETAASTAFASVKTLADTIIFLKNAFGTGHEFINAEDYLPKTNTGQKILNQANKKGQSGQNSWIPNPSQSASIVQYFNFGGPAIGVDPTPEQTEKLVRAIVKPMMQAINLKLRRGSNDAPALTSPRE
jgi:hypothetical protein